MIDLHYWTTPNGHKVTIFLEEAGVPYKIFPVNIGKGEQFKKEFLAISPNNRIPAMVDRDPPGGGAPIAVMESGAMLLYLADKTGQFIANDIRIRTDILQWLFWQMGNLGPMSSRCRLTISSSRRSCRGRALRLCQSWYTAWFGRMWSRASMPLAPSFWSQQRS